MSGEARSFGVITTRPSQGRVVTASELELSPISQNSEVEQVVSNAAAERTILQAEMSRGQLAVQTAEKRSALSQEIEAMKINPVAAVEAKMGNVLGDQIAVYAKSKNIRLNQANFNEVLQLLNEDPAAWEKIKGVVASEVPPGFFARNAAILERQFGAMPAELANPSAGKLTATAVAGAVGYLFGPGFLYPFNIPFPVDSPVRNSVVMAAIAYGTMTPSVAEVVGNTFNAAGRLTAAAALGMPYNVAKFIVNSTGNLLSGRHEALGHNFDELLNGGMELIDFVLNNPAGFRAIDSLDDSMKAGVYQTFEKFSSSAPAPLQPLFRYLHQQLIPDGTPMPMTPNEHRELVVFLRQTDHSEFSADTIASIGAKIQANETVSEHDQLKYITGMQRQWAELALQKTPELATGFNQALDELGQLPEEAQLRWLNRMQLQKTTKDFYPDQLSRDKGISAFNSFTGSVLFTYMFITVLYNSVLGVKKGFNYLFQEGREKRTETKETITDDRPPSYWRKQFRLRQGFKNLVGNERVARVDINKALLAGSVLGLGKVLHDTGVIKVGHNKMFSDSSVLTALGRVDNLTGKNDKGEKVKGLMAVDETTYDQSENGWKDRWEAFKAARSKFYNFKTEDKTSRADYRMSYYEMINNLPKVQTVRDKIEERTKILGENAGVHRDLQNVMMATYRKLGHGEDVTLRLGDDKFTFKKDKSLVGNVGALLNPSTYAEQIRVKTGGYEMVAKNIDGKYYRVRVFQKADGSFAYKKAMTPVSAIKSWAPWRLVTDASSNLKWSKPLDFDEISL